MEHRKKLSLMLVVILSLAAILACNLLSNFTESDEPPVEPTSTTAVSELTATDSAQEQAASDLNAERVQLDPCELLTEEEVTAVLGGPVQIQPSMGTGGCVYVQQSDDPSVMLQLALSAAQGNEAKTFTVLSLGLLAGFSGDPEIQAGFEDVSTQLPSLTLQETVSRMAELFSGTGVTVVEADGPGESAVWLVYESEFYSQGTLILVRGEEYVSLTQIGGDMEAAFEELGSLGDRVFERLPESFYVLDEDGDGSFSFDSSGGEGQAPTMTSEPTLPPTVGCVPEMLSPQEGTVMDNGCSEGSDSIIWAFEWSECPGAQSYELYVIGSNATIPVIEDRIPITTYQYQSPGYIPDLNRLGWRWKVRAMQNDVWGEWTPERTFDVEPLDTDCSSGDG